jgi:hypothetical protein
MRRSLTPLIVLLLLQLVLALALLMRRDPLAGSHSDTPLLRADVIKGADRLVIESKPAAPTAAPAAAAAPAAPAVPPATQVVLQKKDGTWLLPEAFDAPADGAKVNALLDRLAGLKRGLPIATSQSALRRFKLLDADFERRLALSAGGKTLGTVYFGSSPGPRKSDARTAEDRAVYAVDLPTYELPTELGAWLNQDLLKADSGKAVEIDVQAAGPSRGPIQLVRQKGTDKQPETWTDPALNADQHLDGAHAASLAQDLAQLHVEAVLGSAPKPEWQQDHPAVTLSFKDDQSQSIQWKLSRPTAGDFYVLKSSAHPWFFSISTALGKQLIDGSSQEALIVAAKPSAAGRRKP